MRSPVVWSVLVTALLAYAAMPWNGGFYESVVNYDPQGEGQQHEWAYATRIFQYTSGYLLGQLVALITGFVLARRHTQAVALAVAVPVGVLLAGVTFAVAYPLARALDSRSFTTPALDDPVLARLLTQELAAYPLCAAAGVGLGVLLRRRRLLTLVAALWFVAGVTGLLQDDRFDLPQVLLWTVPPIAAGTAIALAGLSMDAWSFPAVLVGDWGRTAGTALLVGAAAYAVGLNLLAALSQWRRRRAVTSPAESDPPGRPGPTSQSRS